MADVQLDDAIKLAGYACHHPIAKHAERIIRRSRRHRTGGEADKYERRQGDNPCRGQVPIRSELENAVGFRRTSGNELAGVNEFRGDETPLLLPSPAKGLGPAESP